MRVESPEFIQDPIFYTKQTIQDDIIILKARFRKLSERADRLEDLCGKTLRDVGRYLLQFDTHMIDDHDFMEKHLDRLWNVFEFDKDEEAQVMEMFDQTHKPLHLGTKCLYTGDTLFT